jgi:hypothetical protein
VESLVRRLESAESKGVYNRLRVGVFFYSSDSYSLVSDCGTDSGIYLTNEELFQDFALDDTSPLKLDTIPHFSSVYPVPVFEGKLVRMVRKSTYMVDVLALGGVYHVRGVVSSISPTGVFTSLVLIELPTDHLIEVRVHPTLCSRHKLQVIKTSGVFNCSLHDQKGTPAQNSPLAVADAFKASSCFTTETKGRHD